MTHLLTLLSLLALTGASLIAQPLPRIAVLTDETDSDRDGLPDVGDTCPRVKYTPGFAWGSCAPMDLNPDNDAQPECKARERIARFLINEPRLLTRISFAVVNGGRVHFADAFERVGGNLVHDPDGVHRLYRIGSTSKAVVATAAKILEERGQLSFADFVDDNDGSKKLVGGQRTLRQLLTHQGAFKLDNGAIHLYCYPGDLAAFWANPDDLISPHFTSATYGNLGQGYQYSAFNYSLAGAYLANRAGESFASVLQRLVFTPAGMCTATLDGARAVTTPIGNGAGIAQDASMHVGPYTNLVSPSDPFCADNYYSSSDLYGQNYSSQVYRLDESGAEARDPPGGVMCSAIDLANFAQALLASYRASGGLLSQAGVRDLWAATHDFNCAPNCAYQRYYGVGFFTAALAGQPVTEVEHGGARPGYKSAFVLRPEANKAVCILANADVSTVTLSALAKTILDDF